MKEYINKIVEGHDLEPEEAEIAMKTIMSGEATPAQIGAFLTALRMKGESVQEITALAKVMRKFAENIHPEVEGTLLDTCGTGGDKVKTFNISTITAFVVAGTGINIAKHGNRSVTSKSGSADLLEELGVNLMMPPSQVQKCIEDIGMGFMFAPGFHKAMKYAIGPRKEVGIRTVFNILGPLTNPANASSQVLGVFDSNLTEPIAHVLNGLGVERAMVVHGMEGMDEISLSGPTRVSELKDGKVTTYEITPEDFGLKRAPVEELQGGGAPENAKLARMILKGQLVGPKREIIVLNAAAGIYVAGKADSIIQGIKMAEQSIDSGAAYKKLAGLIEATDS